MLISANASLLDVLRPQVLTSAVLACLGYFGFMTSQYFILNWMQTLIANEGLMDAQAIGCLVVGPITARLDAGAQRRPSPVPE